MQNKPTIMIVDDKENNVRLLECFLLPYDYRVIKAYDGRQALQLLEEAAVDLIFLDIVMPGLNGFDVLKIIKGNEKNRFIPVILLTAVTSKQNRIKGLELGADDFISKPFDSSELLARTKSLLRIKTLYDRLQQSYEDLKKAEQGRELITHMVAHDMRSPLLVIHGSLQLLSAELEKRFTCLEEFDDFLHPRTILRMCKRLERLIDDMLDTCKIEDGRFVLTRESVDVGDLLRKLINEYKGEAVKKAAKLHFQTTNDIPQIEADRNLITRVLENLIFNAMKNIPDKGEICLKAFFDISAGLVLISVADNGRGIPPEYLSSIFDKYAQVRIKREGVTHSPGLGLTFCKMAVEAHGGNIWVESAPGRGSTFSFTLPVRR